MNAKEFKRWRKAHGLSQTGAARKLGLKIRTIQYYEKGKRKDKRVDIPKAVALACFAISCGVEDVDYTEPEGRAIRPDAHDLLTPR
ncbi:MAG: helix-turn-helix transcriptional regulator [Pseudomonadota bacterium]|nr:helix-turn-helix transcriptional regulator [Pseudomonadota bacterium]